MNETVKELTINGGSDVVKAIHESNMDWFNAGLKSGVKYAIVGVMVGGLITCVHAKLTKTEKSKGTTY